MKVNKLLILLVLLAFSTAACVVSAPTASPPISQSGTNAPDSAQTSTPTHVYLPAISADSSWERIRSSGNIKVGTSADYPPFEYYDSNYEIVGFDAALARQLGSRLGLQVELVDIPFEGLPAALQTGQIDAAIAAISITPGRMNAMDFTNVYYSGQDAVLARQDSGMPTIDAAAQLAQYRVGVQRGSIYGSWLQNTLIDPGLMPETNMLQYAKAGEAVRDLRENRVDLVVFDKAAAEEFILLGGVVEVGRGLNNQSFAIALPKGASSLQEQLNAGLDGMIKDGTIARMAETFLEIKLPAVTPTPMPQPTATPIPFPTSTPPGCYDSMAFVQDMSIPDGTQIKQGENFSKIWRIRNIGTCAWNNSYKLDFVQGDRMSGIAAFVTGNLPTGVMYDMVVNLKAPNVSGVYTGIWQMVNDKGIPFGERVRVRITVPGTVPPTPVPPTATSVPPVTPTPVPAPVIDFLNASASTVQQDELLTVSWSFSGSGIASARLIRTNPDGSLTQLNGGADLLSQGQYEDVMAYPGTYSYTLTVSSEFGSTAVKTVVVNVAPPTPVAALRKGEWVLTRFINPVKPELELAPIEGAELVVAFGEGGFISGFSGCNSFRAQYTVPGGNFIEITNVSVTGKMACEDAIMGQEALYMDLLRSVEQFEILGKELVLMMKNPEPGQDQILNILRFKKK
jgi:polar amino acid transport system substrate-binding protein